MRGSLHDTKKLWILGLGAGSSGGAGPDGVLRRGGADGDLENRWQPSSGSENNQAKVGAMAPELLVPALGLLLSCKVLSVAAATSITAPGAVAARLNSANAMF